MKPGLKRKTILVSVYYYGEHEPKIDKWDDPEVDIDEAPIEDVLFLNDGIEAIMKLHNPQIEIFDIAIDETKPVLFNTSSRLARYMFRVLRKS